MTIQEMLALIALKCGNRDIEEMEEFALPYFSLKQAELEADPFLPWFLVHEAEQAVTDPGFTDLPEGFIKFTPSSGVWYNSPEGKVSQLCLKSIKEGLEKYGLEEGAPKAVALQKNGLALYPAPDSGSLFFEYYKKEPKLDLNSTPSNAWTEYAPWYLISLVGLEVAQDLEHAPGVKFFREKAEAAREMLFRQDAERAISGARLTF